MLNDTTKRKINSLRDILVGVVPSPEAQVNQITNALIYKYMDDMDRQAEMMGGKPSFFTSEFEKYSWRNLMDPKRGGQERMNLYVEALESMGSNKKLPALFRDILKGAFLPYRNPNTLNLFLSEIDGFSYDHSEELGNAFEYLLSIMGSQGDAGQFRTPRHIIDFMVKVVDPQKDETILDPACGTAGFLITAYKHIVDDHDGKDNKTGKATVKEKRLTSSEMKKLHKNFVGYDINPDMTKFSRVNMFLHNFPDPRIYDYDTLGDDSRWEDRFDIILANPPFMTPKGGIVPHGRFIKAKRSEVLFVDYFIEHLNKKGRAGIIIPEGIIFKSENAYKTIRKKLIDDGLIAVVSLPSGVFQPYSGVKTSILFFDNQLVKKSDEICFVKIENDGFDLGAQRREISGSNLPEAIEILKVWKKGKKRESALAHWVKKKKIAESGDYNLSGERYASNSRMAEINGTWPMVKLGDVCEILNGYAFKSNNYVDNGVRIIRITNVQKGEIVDDNPKFYPLDTKEKIENYELFENDLLVSLTGNVGRVGLLPKELLPAALNQRVACLRMDSGKIESRFLFYFLNQDIFEQECIRSASGIAQKNLSTAWLGKYKIPLPSLEVQKQIVAEIDGYQKIIDGARQVVENWKPKIDIDPEWERIKIGKLVEDMHQGVNTAADKIKFVSDGYPIIQARDITSGTLNIKGTKKLSESDFKKYKAKYNPNLNNVLLSNIGTVGKSVVINKNQDFIIAWNIFILKLNKNVLPGYLKMCFDRFDADNYWQQFMTGGTVKFINKKTISETEISLPSLAVQKEIVGKIEAERAMIESSERLIEIYEKKIKDVVNKVWGA